MILFTREYIYKLLKSHVDGYSGGLKNFFLEGLCVKVILSFKTLKGILKKFQGAMYKKYIKL